MAENESEISFDRAEYADAPGSPTCGSCQGALGEQYWRWQNLVMCANCRVLVASQLAASQSRASFAKAALQGGATALACGIGYAVFVGVTKYQLALLTIGIAFLVAKVIRKSSQGISGRKFQVLAVVLTYCASTMGYAPALWTALMDGKAKHETTSASGGSAPVRASAFPAAGTSATAAPSDAPADAPATAEASARSEETQPAKSGGSAAGFLVALAMLVGLLLITPVLSATDAPLGLLIVAFGLWEAWKLTRGLPLVIEGPFRVASRRPRRNVLRRDDVVDAHRQV